jgi:hypothetical protein
MNYCRGFNFPLLTSKPGELTLNPKKCLNYRLPLVRNGFWVFSYFKLKIMVNINIFLTKKNDL